MKQKQKKLHVSCQWHTEEGLGFNPSPLQKKFLSTPLYHFYEITEIVGVREQIPKEDKEFETMKAETKRD
jgi:hypothetical protein